MKFQKDKSWPLACDGNKIGFIPVNYVHIKMNDPINLNIDEVSGMYFIYLLNT